MTEVTPAIAEADVQFTINEETCVKCGFCAKDCPFGIIKAEPEEFPVLLDEKTCIRCQHCFAVCPTASLSILGKDPEEATQLRKNLPEKDQLITLIKGRRSVRQYKDENLPAELIDEMLDAVWHAPTGHNSQQSLLTVVDEKETVAKIRDEIYTKLKDVLKKDGLKNHPAGEYFAMAVQMRDELGVDIIFRGAPHILLISSPENGPSPVQDTHIALTTFDLLAPTMGVGTLWNGMLKWALGLFPEIKTKLGIPEDHLIGYSMIFGKPAIKYQRTTERSPARVNKVAAW